MSTTQLSSDTTTEAPASTATTVAMRFEVATLPVTDVERAKVFYESIGWRLDIDFKPDGHTRSLQFTPPGSPASIHFSEGKTTMPPGSLEGLLLIVDDIVAARDELVSRGAEVSDFWHTEPGQGRAPGIDPQRRSYFSWASFADPDGNRWLLQEVTERLPGRVTSDVAGLAELLHETADHHGDYEAVAPAHDWWDWYAAYLDARERGSASEAAVAAAGHYMEDVKHVSVPRS